MASKSVHQQSETLVRSQSIGFELALLESIIQDNEKNHAVAIAIVASMEPENPDDDEIDWNAYMLAKVLLERLEDNSSMQVLMDSLHKTRDALAQHGGAA